jgi:archaellum biogenesis ATPase FlaH
MIEFPETAANEWRIVADAANIQQTIRKRINRGTRIESEVENLRVRHEARLLFQQELDADQTPALEMTTLADFLINPSQAPTDLIDGVMKENGLTIMLGPSGSGKSTLGLQMVYCLTTGHEWLGQTAKQLNGGVGVLSYDMDAGMVLDWMAGFPGGVDPDKVSVVNAYKRGNPLGVREMRAQIASAWRANNTEIVVLDSFSASFFGADQNDAAATMAHYRDLKLFALTEVGAKAVIVIVHSTEASPFKPRGSSVHQDAADTIVGVMADAKTQQRSVRMVKYRAARGQHEMGPVMITAPDDVTHLVDLDLGAMSLAGMKLPAGIIGSEAFPELPEAQETPEAETAIDEEDDL